jgi:hypothetical protein
VVVSSEAWVYDHSVAGIAGLNSAEGMDFRLLCLFCVVQVTTSVTSWSLVQRCLPRVYVCVCVELCVIKQPQQWSGLIPIWTLAPQKNKQVYNFLNSISQPRYCTDIALWRIFSLLRHWCRSSLIGSFTQSPPPPTPDVSQITCLPKEICSVILAGNGTLFL